MRTSDLRADVDVASDAECSIRSDEHVNDAADWSWQKRGNLRPFQLSCSQRDCFTKNKAGYTLTRLQNKAHLSDWL